MSRDDDLKCVCNGSGYVNDLELGNLICGCTFKVRLGGDMNRDKYGTVHAIAHFDFDGSCNSCPCSGWVNGRSEGKCQLSKTNFDITRVPYDERHKQCPLCIEDNGW